MAFAPLFPFLQPWLQNTFPQCLWQGNPDRPEIALTFDDGPHPVYTMQLLEVLDELQIKASFFWLGAGVKAHPHVAQAVYARGHWIGLHGYDHQSFPFLTLEKLQESLAETKNIIYQVCGLEPSLIKDLRPPNGLFTPEILTALNSWGYRVVQWTVVPEDWVRPSQEEVYERVLSQVKNGAIIVLHDGTSGGQDVAKNTRAIAPTLLAQNYQFVSVDRLWQS